MTKTIDLLCIGNPCADVYIRCERAPGWDDKCPGVAAGTHAGGTESNVACAASQLGWRSAVLGAVGDDHHGAVLTEAFANAGVDTRWLSRRDHAASASTVILLSPHGERSIIWVPLARELGPPDWLEDAIAHTRTVYTMAYGADELARLRALTHAHGARLAIDIEHEAARHPGVLQRTLALCDAAFMNESAYQSAMGASPSEAALSRLVAATPVDTLVVSLGARGAIAADRLQAARCPAQPTPVVDTTGAGDTFNATFLVARDRGLSLHHCLRVACAAAARTVGVLGARSELPRLDALVGAERATPSRPNAPRAA